MANTMRARPEVITTLRERSGHTLGGLATEAGIDKATLWRIEDGKSAGRPATLLAIAEALSVPLSVIVSHDTTEAVA